MLKENRVHSKPHYSDMGNTHLYIFGGVGVLMVVVCLIVREGTETRLARMRRELMALRSQERGLENKINGLQTVKEHLRESIGRAEGRSLSAKQLLDSIYEKLEGLYEQLRGEPCPKPPELEGPCRRGRGSIEERPAILDSINPTQRTVGTIII